MATTTFKTMEELAADAVARLAHDRRRRNGLHEMTMLLVEESALWWRKFAFPSPMRVLYAGDFKVLELTEGYGRAVREFTYSQGGTRPAGIGHFYVEGLRSGADGGLEVRTAAFAEDGSVVVPYDQTGLSPHGDVTPVDPDRIEDRRYMAGRLADAAFAKYDFGRVWEGPFLAVSDWRIDRDGDVAKYVRAVQGYEDEGHVPDRLSFAVEVDMRWMTARDASCFDGECIVGNPEDMRVPALRAAVHAAMRP